MIRSQLVILWRIPCFWWCYSLATFKILSSSLSFYSLSTMHLSMGVFELTLLRICWASWVCWLIVFIKFGKLFTYFSTFFSVTFSPLLLLNLTLCTIGMSDGVLQIPEALFIVLYSFSFLSSDCIIINCLKLCWFFLISV